MNKLVSVSVSVFAVAATFIAATLAHDSESVHVVQLEKSNFDDAIGQSNHFVMFFAPWCGHCQRLGPTWEQLAEMLNVKEGGRVTIAKVDCTANDNNELCSDQEVTGYPTLKFFKVGSPESVKFRGARDLPALTTFINEQLGDGGELDDDESEANRVDTPPAINNLIELTEETFSKHVATGKHFVKFYAPWCGHCQKLAPTWDDLAQSLEHQNTVSIAKVDCTQHRPVCQDFEVKGYPTLLWIEDGKKIEKYSGSRTHEELKAYVDKMLNVEADEATPKMASAESTGTDDDIVLQLTTGDFEHAIEKGITFVKFFAPWCGHCKRLAPTWDDLASKFVGQSDVKIAKVDCTLADNKELCAAQEIDGFPTLFIYKNGEKLSEYNGSRALDDLFDFVNRQNTDGHDEL